MDPISGIIGLAASITGILQVLNATVRTLASLAGKYRNSQDSISILKIQTTTVRDALEALLEWIDRSPPNARLIEKLQNTISGCRFLIF